MNIPLRGNLRDWSLTRIFVELNRNRATGTLSATTPAFTRNIYLRDGNVIFASSTFEDDRLGEMLVKAGKISMEQYDRSVELLKTTGRRQGAILVDLGYITPKDLFWGVKYQVKEIICSVFLLEEGTYEFNESTVPPDEVITLKISMNNLIYDCVSRIDNWTRIRREMPDAGTVFALNEDQLGIFKGIDLSTQDRTILSLVDGKRSISRLIEDSRMNSFDVMKTLYVLWSTGFIAERRLPIDGEETVNIGEEIKESITEEELAFERKVEELYWKVREMSPAEILQIGETADSEEVKRNYYRLAKEFHPDRVNDSDNPALRDRIGTIFDAVTKAYDEMKGDANRRDFFSSPGRVRNTEEDTHAALLEEQFRRGIEEFKKGNFWGSAELFRLVTRKSPKNARAWSYLSLALSKIPNRLKEAEEALLESIRLEPFNGEHFANLGHLYLMAGLRKRALHQFEKALRLDPDNAKAKKGIEQLQPAQ
jgi:tetratricopeptide (TPR) repeat protein